MGSLPANRFAALAKQCCVALTPELADFTPPDFKWTRVTELVRFGWTDGQHNHLDAWLYPSGVLCHSSGDSWTIAGARRCAWICHTGGSSSKLKSQFYLWFQRLAQCLRLFA